MYNGAKVLVIASFLAARISTRRYMSGNFISVRCAQCIIMQCTKLSYVYLCAHKHFSPSVCACLVQLVIPGLLLEIVITFIFRSENRNSNGKNEYNLIPLLPVPPADQT